MSQDLIVALIHLYLVEYRKTKPSWCVLLDLVVVIAFSLNFYFCCVSALNLLKSLQFPLKSKDRELSQ